MPPTAGTKGSPGFAGFPRALPAFLRSLAQNNDRAWFERRLQRSPFVALSSADGGRMSAGRTGSALAPPAAKKRRY